ncbi:pilin PilA [Natronomonas pharaonis DSM 2160]|uniref:Pilin PilA n=1 Tax=Natronomonas pharaonis (strain ATCC 35678 / DSM 2160 / CIP 103997 / JCM 8858 / NBRC 14720 / NCIMB 2260 / Gabara) TaxID=348780 RepID=A0A1U7EVL6_NATPD|nr:type IV pilin N-terminal domain-containing protein [Natronomonas pharaonis]CAI49069.1 pilin PilA [Natronomonas pharaonis DSM 2160]
MNLSNLLNPETDDRRAVSPVIGVILMVAITVILAAVIGTFVLGLGDQVQETAPNAQISADNGTDNGNIETTFTHESGDSINAENLFVTGSAVDGERIRADDEDLEQNVSDTMRAGGQIVLNSDGSPGSFDPSGSDDIRLVWQSQEGERTSTLASFEYGQ